MLTRKFTTQVIAKNKKEFFKPKTISRFIQHLALFNNAKHIVEIGVAYGSTTKFLCAAAQQFDGHVWAIDCWSIHGLRKQHHQKGHCELVDEFLTEQGCTNFTLIQANTQTQTDTVKEIIEHDIKTIDLAYIDGCHSYKGTKIDFDLVYPYLANNGIIVIDDTLHIDGTREFALDLRTKYFDGTYDVVDFLFGGQNEKFGTTVLMKRCKRNNNVPITQICDSISSKQDIINNERKWHEEEVEKYKK